MCHPPVGESASGNAAPLLKRGQTVSSSSDGTREHPDTASRRPSPGPPDTGRNALSPLVLGALSLLVLVFACAAYLSTSTVQTAAFRITARSDLVGVSVASDVEFSVRVRNWSALGADAIEFDHGGTEHAQDGSSLSVSPAQAANKQAVLTDTRVAVYVEGGTELKVKSASEHGNVRLEFNGKPARLSFQPFTPQTAVRIGSGEEHRTREVLGGFTVQTQASGAILDLELNPTANSVLFVGVPISSLGFAEPRSDPRNQQDFVRAGLLEGWVQFLDLPAGSLKLLPGTDIRLKLSEPDTGMTRVDRLELAANAVTVTASGSADSIDMVIGADKRTLMPSRWDRLSNLPTTSVILGLLAALGGTLSLLFGFLGVQPAIAKFFRRPRRYQ